MEKGEFMFSLHIALGYMYFYSHPIMRDVFLFHYCGRFFLCVALPFMWGRSAPWFTKIMRSFVKYMRKRWNYHVLPYTDDFLISPSRPGRSSTYQDSHVARGRLKRLMHRIGVTWKLGKGEWEGGRRMDHLGVHLDRTTVSVYVLEKKVKPKKEPARLLIWRANLNRCVISSEALHSLLITAVLLSLALPLTSMFTLSLYLELSGEEC